MIRDNSSYPYPFLLMYALIFAGNAIYNTFISVYLDSVGFSRTTIGALLALGPFVAIVAQPIWGMAGDRAKVKNGVLKILIAGSALAILAYPLSVNLYYLFVVIAVFTFFQTSIFPLSDAITLEYLDTTRWKFGPIRMGGTIGFSIMSVAAGAILNKNISNMFVMYFTVLAVTFLMVLKLPHIKGHQSGGDRVALWELFRNRELLFLMFFSLIYHSTLGFYYSFFPIYYREIGGNSVLLGWVMFISAVSEIPFLLFADKIVNKIGITYTLTASAAATAVRWLLIHLAKSPFAVLPISMLHGVAFIVFTYCMATYINREVPKELRASGQTLNWLIAMGLARIIGSVIGGVLSDMIGIRQVFLYTSLLNFGAVMVFGGIFARVRK